MVSTSLCNARGTFVTPRAVSLHRPRAAPGGAAQAGRRLAVAVRAESQDSKGKLSLLFFSALAAPARADTVDDAVSTITTGVQSAGTAIKSGLGAAQVAAGYAKEAADKVAPVAKKVVDASVPVAKQAASTITKAAEPALKSAADKIPDAGQQIDKALSQQGINAKPVVQAGAQALDTVKPAASNFVSWFLAQNLTVKAETVLAAAAVFYVGPSVLRFLADALQGYRGDLSAPGAVNTLTTDGNAILVDIRRVGEKEGSGDPVLPPSAAKRTVELEYSFTEDKKLRGMFANADAVEAKITALKIAALKRTSQGAPLILLDKNGSTSKAVAKDLARMGFGQVYVITGGFDGRNGWVQSKLQTKLAKTVSTATIVKATPVRKQVTPAPAGTISASKTTTVLGLPVGTTKALPAGKKALPPPKK